VPDFASITIVTPALGLLLTTSLLMAAPAKEEDPAARAQATLQQVSKLPLDHQRVWLRLIEQRYGWAVLLTLKPEDARLEQARVAKILRQKTVGWNELTLLLRDLDQREKAAIARLVRQYRTEVYETFQKRPRDLMDRQDAWYRIWSLWEKAGSPPEQQDRLMDWLAAAIKACGKDSITPLPPDPKFGEGVELVPEQLVKKLTQPAVPPAPPSQPADDFVPLPDVVARTPLPVRVLDSRRAREPAKRPADAIVGRRAEKNQPDGLLAAAPSDTPPPVTPPPVMLPAARTFPLVAIDDPQEFTTPPAPPHPELAVVIERGLLVATERSAEAALARIAQADAGEAKPQTVGTWQQPSELPKARMVDAPPEPPAAASPQVALPPRAISRADGDASGAESLRKPAALNDVSALVPHKAVDFAVSRTPDAKEYQVERKPLGPDPAPSLSSQPPAPPSTPSEPHAEVNIAELGTRIEGINLSLRNLEGDLHEKREFTVDQLDSLLSRLDILVLRQKDLTLFRDLVSPRDQAKVGQIDSPRSLVAAMGTHIAELRIRVRDNQSAPEAERAAALKRLDELSDRLATMTAEK
jgi:hypothetical protein